MNSIAYQIYSMVSLSFMRYGSTLVLWHLAPLKTQNGLLDDADTDVFMGLSGWNFPGRE